MNKKAGGYFTVEAAVMFPVLIYATATLIFLLTFIYDSILALQDMNSLEASIKVSEQDFYYTYREIINDHPYISIASSGVNVSLSEKNGKTILTLSCNWVFPLAESLNKPIIITREFSINNPIKIMREKNGLMGGFKNNDKNEND